MRQSRRSRRRSFLWVGIGLLILSGMWVGNWSYARWSKRYEDQLRIECQQSYQTQDWDQLQNTAEKWVKFNRESADGWLFLADAAQKKGDFERTIECLKRIPQSHPKAIPALLEASHLQFGLMNRPRDGVKTCREILKINPRVGAAHQRLIFWYALTIQRLSMIAQIREAIRQESESPDAYVYLMLSDHLSFTNGYALNSRWLTSDPQSELLIVARAVHMDDSLSRLENKDQEPEQARLAREQLMRDYLKQYPSNPALLRYFLRSSAAAGDVEQVGRLLEQVPDEAADDSVFWRYRGWYHAAFSEFEQSEQAYRRAIELFPLDWHVWHELAGVLRRTGDLKVAEEMEKLALAGKQLRKELLQLPDAQAVPPSLLERIGLYAKSCGDRQVAEAIKARMTPISF